MLGVVRPPPRVSGLIGSAHLSGKGNSCRHEERGSGQHSEDEQEAGNTSPPG